MRRICVKYCVIVISVSRLIKLPLFVPGPDRASHSRQFFLAARFLDPENQEAVEALIQDLGLEFMGAEV